MRYYPLLLDLTRMHCLVVGAGDVGLRKITTLLECGPRCLTVLDPRPPGPEIGAMLAHHANMTYIRRAFDNQDIDSVHMVFACTSARETNNTIAAICREAGVLCNIIDAPQEGNFVLPASITRGDLTITVSTSCASPALSRSIRQELEKRFGPEYAPFTRLLGTIRTAVLALGQSCSENQILFRNLAKSSLPELIKTGNREQCQTVLTSLLPEPLHGRIGEWCDDCFPTV